MKTFLFASIQAQMSTASSDCADRQTQIREYFFFITEHKEIKVSQHRYENRNQSRDIKKSCLSQTLIWLTMSLVVSELFGESLCNNYPQNNASRSESEISALLHFWLSEQACRGFMRLLTSPKVKYFSKPSWYMP